jgi:hypothetical protein
MSDLSITRGDVGYFDITVAMPDGADLTGCTLAFMAKRRYGDADSAAVISKGTGSGITITDATARTARLKLDPEDTSALDAPATLVWDLVLTDANQEPHTVDSGRLIALPDVRRA